MSSQERMQISDIKVDSGNLYREDTVTDMKVAQIRRMIPIKVDGSDDPDRATVFMGSTQVMSQMGPLPINFELDAADLKEAMEKFPAAAKEAIKRMIDEVREAQRQEAGRIVVPQGGAPGVGQPGQPGGGKIQL
jgi:hypothetical protein